MFREEEEDSQVEEENSNRRREFLCIFAKEDAAEQIFENLALRG